MCGERNAARNAPATSGKCHGATVTNALDLLCRHGLFIYLGLIFRCVHNCEAEIYFLLKKFPHTSSQVDQFVKSFLESTIYGYLSMETHSVRTKKIRNAMVRILENRQDEETHTTIYRIPISIVGFTTDLACFPPMPALWARKEHALGSSGSSNARNR
jgi:hypothetical protein